MGFPDKTYDRKVIDKDPIWKLAFWMSEIDNDNAPIGWNNYIPLARSLTDKYELVEK